MKREYNKTWNALSSQKTSTAILTIICISISAYFIHLGLWQLDRLKWKQELLHKIEQSSKTAAIPLGDVISQARKDPRSVDYTPVTATLEWRVDLPIIALFTTKGEDKGQQTPGISYFAPAQWRNEQGNQAHIFVNIGFERYEAFKARKTPLILEESGTTTITALIRAPEKKTVLTGQIKDDKGLYYLRNPEEIVRHMDLRKTDFEPFTLHMLQSSVEASHNTPVPTLSIQTITANLPNNHLSYAMTWFALAAVLAISAFIWFWHRRQN